ncbi:MAG: hypothetical protein WBG54_07200 [Acidobacteriaceae bacterium]
MKLTATVIATALVFTVCSGSGASQSVKATGSEAQFGPYRPLSEAGRSEAVEAILDEIYADNLEGYVPDVGQRVTSSEYRLTIYFKPTLNANGEGWAVYKLMPYGQVLRMFTLEHNGMAVLFGDPHNKFPPTEPSYLTVYMDDSELCRLEEQWPKQRIIVQLHPSPQRVDEAKQRQSERE